MGKKFDKLDSMVWFLTLNFYNEFPNSFLPKEAFIEGRVVYNCSFGELIYDLKNLRIKTVITDEDYYFVVNQVKEIVFWKSIVDFIILMGLFHPAKLKSTLLEIGKKIFLKNMKKDWLRISNQNLYKSKLSLDIIEFSTKFYIIKNA
jgi:hypothetical protein